MLSMVDKIGIISIIQSISGSLSLIGSMTIIFTLLRSDGKLCSTYRRLVFGMSVSDALSSCAFVLCAVPTQSIYACDIQGFFVHLGALVTPMYNCSLSTYYVLTVIFDKSEKWVKHRVEPFLHTFAISWPVGTGIYLLFTSNFNPAGPNCWIAPKPRDCIIEPSIECERGENSYKYRWWFVAYPTVIIFFFIVISMIALCIKVTRRERVLDEITSSSLQVSESIEPQGSNSGSSVSKDETKGQSTLETKRLVVKQALVYAAAYFLPNVFPLVFYVVLLRSGKRNFGLWIAVAIFFPLQGLFNCFVFIRPRVMSLRKAYPDYSFVTSFLITIKARRLQANSAGTMPQSSTIV